MNIEGRTAVVTGGASGLGEATVRLYVERGAKVAIFDINDQRGYELEKELGAENAKYFNVDVSDENSVGNSLRRVVEIFGGIHICNNYAGIGMSGRTLGKNGVYPLDMYIKTLNVNLVGTFNVCRLVAKIMAKNAPASEDGNRGVIINTSSIAAFEGQMGQVAYSASKGGIVGMTLPMARDLASYGIRVNTIAPGIIHTPLFDTLPQPEYERLISSVVYPKRLGRPGEIAHLSLMIVENDYLNGECIRLDGALRMQAR